MKSRNSRLLAGLILLVIGASVLAYGLIALDSARSSLGGGLAKLLNGTSDPERQAIIEMVAGAALAVIGLVFLLARRSRR